MGFDFFFFEVGVGLIVCGVIKNIDFIYVLFYGMFGFLLFVGVMYIDIEWLCNYVVFVFVFVVVGMMFVIVGMGGVVYFLFIS